MKTIEEINIIRNKLRNFVTSEEGGKLRIQLENLANQNYMHKHTLEEYLKYMNIHQCSFKRNGNQCTNHSYVWTMFSVPSQHATGDCIEECLDNAILKSRGLI